VIGVLLVTAAIFVLGGALILSATLLPVSRAIARELWPFYRSEFLIVGAILLPSAADGWFFLTVLVAAALRGQWELFTLFRQSPKALTSVVAMMAGAGLVGTGMFAPDRLPVAALAGVILLLVLGQLKSSRTGLAIASLVFPSLAVALVGVLRNSPQGFLWLLLVQVTVETNDSFALLVGKLIGGTRVFPRLSPGKTLAGLVGGLAAGLLAGLVVSRLLLELSFYAAFASTIVALAAGLAGDLLLSALKRQRDVKDFPPVALLHGGLLDIYDSLLFAVPALLLLRSGLRL
jgi:phosphatidate cytidylyltransferase